MERKKASKVVKYTSSGKTLKVTLTEISEVKYLYQSIAAILI